MGMMLLVQPAGAATAPSLVIAPVDPGAVVPLPGHHPAWATAANRTAPVADDQDFEQMTLVLARPASQQAAFEQFLADLQNPSSSSYHQWLTPEEVGQRFGLSDADLAAVTGWLTAQGLHVNLIAPSRTSIQFGGTAANLGRAFQTTLGNYTVDGQQRLSVDSEPSIPAVLAPAIRAVRGLFTIGEHPLHSSTHVQLNAPAYTLSKNGTHVLTPADFATIYNVPSTFTGAGVTIGIVGWSRVYTGDLNAFRSITGSTFSNPTQVVPTGFGGVDPGPAYSSAPSSCPNDCLGGQEEATLDVIRAGGTAPGASLLLVVSAVSTSNNDGIGADAQYLIETSPVPAQIISISFGACESQAGGSGVSFWDDLFSAANAEGISVFVSSGDSGAAACDAAFSTPLPGTIGTNSPNYICSSQYATCVGGTEFNDSANPSLYWNSTNGAQGQSALSYIPEGAWNESSTSSGIAASGGGVSSFIATPSWQNVTGVPSSRAGRYTPDVAFSAAAHDGYLGCVAAAGSDCVSYISVFSGTSAAAPGMAGIAALLDQKQGGSGQGSLNSALYSKYVSNPSAFNDVTVASSGVSSCSVNTVSLCNNSVYYSSAGAVQPGYAVTTGYDEATGLGSLNVANFLNAFSTTQTPTVTLTPGSSSVTTVQNLWSTVTVSGSSGTPTGTVQIYNGSTAVSTATILNAGSASVEVPSGSLPAGSASLTAAYTPNTGSSSTYNAASSAAVSVSVSKVAPTVTVTPAYNTVNTNQTLAVSVTVSAGTGTTTATGTVTLASGSYTSAAITLSSGAASITVPAGALPGGADSLTASYTPDTAAAALYNAASSTAVPVTANKVAPTVSISPTSTTLTTLQSLAVTVGVSAGSGTATATGTVTLTSGSYTSGAVTLGSGTASITIPAGALPAGSPSLAASYTPDTAGATLYTSATATPVPLTVNKVTPAITVAPGYSSIVPGQALAVHLSVSGGTGTQTATGSVVLSSGSYNSGAVTLSAGAASITIPAGTFGVSTPTLAASYTPDTAGAAIYTSASGSIPLSVAKVTPTVSASALPASITILQTTNITVTVAGNAGNPVPTGSVVLTSGSYTSASTNLVSGAATLTIPAGTLALGSPSVTASYTPDTTGAASFNPNTGSTTVSVGTMAPAFTLSGTAVTVSSGSAATSTITVTPLYGFTGAVTLTAAVTTKPTGGQYAPALGFGSTSPVTVSGAGAVTSTLTVTAANTTAAAPARPLPLGGWRTPAVAALASLVLFLAPTRCRRWQRLLGLVVLGIAALGIAAVGGVVACSSSAAISTPTKMTPTVTVTPATSSITNQQALTVNVMVAGASGTPTGTVTLASGSYSSAAATLSAGAASFSIPAGSLAIGTDTLTVSYTPDATAAASYIGTTGSSAVTVAGASSAGNYVVTVTGTSGGVTATTTVNVTVQ
jgi:hypothetical protein